MVAFFVGKIVPSGVPAHAGLHGGAASSREQHQMIGCDLDADVRAGRIVDVARKHSLQLAASGKLKSIQRRGTLEAFADDSYLQCAVRRMHQIVGP